MESINGFSDENRFLSNFENCEIWFEGIKYPSTENAYQAAKSLFTDIRLKFSDISSSEAKKLGKTILVRDDWKEVRFGTMSLLVFQKFCVHEKLRTKLIATGEKYIEETNWWGDIYWGVCNGKGENNLGKILMNVREFWKKSQKKNEATQLF